MSPSGLASAGIAIVHNRGFPASMVIGLVIGIGVCLDLGLPAGVGSSLGVDLGLSVRLINAIEKDMDSFSNSINSKHNNTQVHISYNHTSSQAQKIIMQPASIF